MQSNREEQSVCRRKNKQSALIRTAAQHHRGQRLDRGRQADQVCLRRGFVYRGRSERSTSGNSPDPKGPLTPDMLDKMNRYWRAANYLCIGQIYLFENPLLREPLKAEQIKPRLLGHWGTSPGQNLIYIHLNRADQRARCKCHLHCWSGTWRSVAQCVLLSGRNLYRSTSGDHAG